MSVLESAAARCEDSVCVCVCDRNPGYETTGGIRNVVKLDRELYVST